MLFQVKKLELHSAFWLMEHGAFIRQRISPTFRMKLRLQSNLHEPLLLDVQADQNQSNLLKFQFFRTRFTGDQRRTFATRIFKQNWTCCKAFTHLQTTMTASYLLHVAGPMNTSTPNSSQRKAWIVRGLSNDRWSMVWLQHEMEAIRFPIECVMAEKVASN